MSLESVEIQKVTGMYAWLLHYYTIIKEEGEDIEEDEDSDGEFDMKN